MSGPCDQFSHLNKHPYLSLSTDLRTVTKSSHSGHRFAAVGTGVLTPQDGEVRLRIDNSYSGHIMLGVCMEAGVRER